MGRTITPTYAVRMYAPGVNYTPAAWYVKRDGRPTDENLRRYVAEFEASTREGGVNAHLGESTILSARITRQATAERVAEYQREGAEEGAEGLSRMATAMLRELEGRPHDAPWAIYNATSLQPAIWELKQAGLIEHDDRGRIRSLA